MRVCTKCKTGKPESEFNVKQGTKKQAYCRTCQSEYHKQHYRDNRKAYHAAGKASRRRVREELDRLKDKPCADCGEKYPPWVMDFDHPEGCEKLGNVSQLAVNTGRHIVLTEAQKCDVVCANCHRQRTHDRLPSSSKGQEVRLSSG